MLRSAAAALSVLLLASCASAPRASPLSGDPELDAFARQVEEDLESHAWQDLLASADPEHYRTQVVDGGMGEPQYLAELFGLHTVGNNIKQGEVVSWGDLERIDTVTLREVSGSEGSYRLHGSVGLVGGGELELRATLVESRGRWRLSGGVG